MNMLYLNYWGIKDVLAQATVYPNILKLAQREDIDTLSVYSIERTLSENLNVVPPSHSKITYLSLMSGATLGNKFRDFYFFPNVLAKHIREKKVDRLLGRGALSGAILYLVWKITKTPFFVESFEPHSSYMSESGVWSKWGLKYRIQHFLEKKQKINATGLMVVTENYRKQLLAENVPPGKLRVVPCTVDLGLFAFRDSQRNEIRRRLRIPQQATVGIYAGKFGDIYFSLPEAFALFSVAFGYFKPEFHLILLTNELPENIKKHVDDSKIHGSNVHVLFVSHDEVPGYLSASDFGYALIKPSPSKRFCSPVKIGEYWASGLPIVLPEGIGDDSEIASQYNGGVSSEKTASYQHLANLIKENDHRTRIMEIARLSRSPARTGLAYDYFFGSAAGKSAT